MEENASRMKYTHENTFYPEYFDKLVYIDLEKVENCVLWVKWINYGLWMTTYRLGDAFRSEFGPDIIFLIK